MIRPAPPSSIPLLIAGMEGTWIWLPLRGIGFADAAPRTRLLEEGWLVIEGAPDIWLDGHLYRLKPGDAVGFPAGTGIAHSFLNNTQAEVHLLVVGERHKTENRIFYPLHPHRRPLHNDWWDDHPTHALGPHDGMPDLVREAKDRGSSG